MKVLKFLGIQLMYSLRILYEHTLQSAVQISVGFYHDAVDLRFRVKVRLDSEKFPNFQFQALIVIFEEKSQK